MLAGQFPLSEINYPALLSVEGYLAKARRRLLDAGLAPAQVEEHLTAMRETLERMREKVDGIA